MQVQQIGLLTLQLINKKYLERGKPAYHWYVDFAKVFDAVWHDGFRTVLESYHQLPQKLVKLLQNLYDQSE